MKKTMITFVAIATASVTQAQVAWTIDARDVTSGRSDTFRLTARGGHGLATLAAVATNPNQPTALSYGTSGGAANFYGISAGPNNENIFRQAAAASLGTTYTKDGVSTSLAGTGGVFGTRDIFTSISVASGTFHTWQDWTANLSGFTQYETTSGGSINYAIDFTLSDAQKQKYLDLVNVHGVTDNIELTYRRNGATRTTMTVLVEAAPEPSSAALLGLGALGLIARRKR